jgi:hypothetical protein
MSPDIFYSSEPIMSKSFYDMIPRFTEIIFLALTKNFIFATGVLYPNYEFHTGVCHG